MQKSSQISIIAVAAALAATLPSVAQAEDSLVKSGSDKTELKFYGQVNRAILFADNGDEDDVFFVDNDNSSTRFGFIGEYKGDLTFGAQIELELESNSSSDGDGPDFGDASGTFELKERILDLYVKGDFGAVYLGQGNSASNGTSEVDLSGTSVVAYSGVTDLAGSLSFNNSGQRIGQVFSNFDGLSRTDRLRYDTPTFGGVTLGASVAGNDEYDLSAKWAGEFNGGKLQLAASYAEPEEDDIDSQYSASGSILLNNGFSFTAAYGEQDRDDSNDPNFYYAKIGYKADLVAAGSTAFSLDYYEGEDIGGNNTESTSLGLFVVQKIDKVGLELYGGVRQYEFDSGANDDDLDVIALGARLKF